jgi:hypothetical protein
LRSPTSARNSAGNAAISHAPASTRDLIPSNRVVGGNVPM